MRGVARLEGDLEDAQLGRRQPVIDLDYVEDSAAETDANFVMTGAGGIVEIQGTAEGAPFSQDELIAMFS